VAESFLPEQAVSSSTVAMMQVLTQYLFMMDPLGCRFRPLGSTNLASDSHVSETTNSPPIFSCNYGHARMQIIFMAFAAAIFAVVSNKNCF
jgi:hypothetical protein